MLIYLSLYSETTGGSMNCYISRFKTLNVILYTTTINRCMNILTKLRQCLRFFKHKLIFFLKKTQITGILPILRNIGHTSYKTYPKI